MQTLKISIDEYMTKVNFGPHLSSDKKTITGNFDLDHNNKDEIADTIDDLLEEGKKNIILDLSNVNYIDSSGLGVLVHGHKKATQHNSCLTILNPTKNIIRIFNITKVNSILKVETSAQLN